MSARSGAALVPVNAAAVSICRAEGLGWRWACWRLRALLLVGGRRRALDLLDGLLGRWPGQPYLLASRGHLRAECGDVAGAVDDLRAAVIAEPCNAAVWFNLGFALEQRGELGDAERAFRRATALDPQLDRAWYGLGLVLIGQRRHQEAIEPLQRATVLQPMSPYSWYQLARVHVALNDVVAAEGVIQHLEGFEPKAAAQLRRDIGCPVTASVRADGAREATVERHTEEGCAWR